MAADVERLQRELEAAERKADAARKKAEEAELAAQARRIELEHRWDEAILLAYRPEELDQAVQDAMEAFERAVIEHPVFAAAIRVRAAQGKRQGAAILANASRGRLGQPLGFVPSPGLFDAHNAIQALVERHGAAAAADAEDEYHRAREEATDPK